MITKELLIKIRPEIDEVLKAVGERHNVVLKLGRGSYDDNGATFKLDVMPVAETGEVITPAIKEWHRYAEAYGFDKDDLGKEFVCNRQVFTICGLNPRKRKHPVLAKTSIGKVFCFGEDSVLLFLGKGRTLPQPTVSTKLADAWAKAKGGTSNE